MQYMSTVQVFVIKTDHRNFVILTATKTYICTYFEISLILCDLLILIYLKIITVAG